MEAADLGVRLCQTAARSIYPCYAMVGIPMIVLALATLEINGWLPIVLMLWAKPWLDRTILFVLSRAAFGQRTRPSDLWRARREVWWRQLLFTLTIRRLSMWRSLTQPVYQLEGFSAGSGRARVRQIRRRNRGAGLMVMSAFYAAEACVMLSVASLVVWMSPAGSEPTFVQVLSGELTGVLSLAPPLAQGVAVLFVEPFYVAAGFAMYLNRRAELEAWDIEQEFRRAFAS